MNRARDGENGLQKNSFYFRVSNMMWNLLPPNVVSVKNMDTFKSRLDEQSGNKFTMDEPTQTEDHERFEEAF